MSIYRWRRNLCSKLGQPTGFAAVGVHADPPEIGYGASDMLIIELHGVTIRSDSLLGMPEYCRRTPIAAMTRSTPRATSQDPSWKQRAGHTPVARSSKKLA